MKDRAILVIALASMTATWLAGWWGVLVVAVIAAAVFRADGGRPWRVAFATMTGWMLLLGFDAVGGPLLRVAATVSGVTAAPAALLLAVTVLLAGLLAWSAATVVGELAQLVTPRRKVTPL